MIAYISKKRKGRLAERKAVEMKVRTKYQACALAAVYGCQGPLDVDEQIPKSEWGEGQYVFSNCWCLCRDCHYQKHHDQPEAAMILGLYGRDRMLRYDLTIDERLDYFEVFRPYAGINFDAGKTFLVTRLNHYVEGR